MSAVRPEKLRHSPDVSVRPRIALVAHKVHERGGMERALAELVRHAHQRVDFHVVSIQLQHDLRRLVTWHRVPVPLKPAPALFVPFYVRAPFTVREVKPDLVHSMGAIMGRRTDLASVQFCHAAFDAGRTPAEPTRPSGVKRLNQRIDRRLTLAAERRAYRPGAVRLLAAASSGIQRELREFYPSTPSVVIPNAADLLRFQPDPAARREVRAEHAIRDDSVVAIFVGGDWHRKGLGAAIGGLAEARARGANRLELSVVGRGDEQRFTRLARDVGVADHVRFHGQQATPERFFAAADIFVFPTAYEAFPLVALEAAATGLPLVATAVNGIEDLVRDGREGLLVHPSALAVGEALERLAVDSRLRAEMGDAARARAGSFTWARVAELTLEAYAELLGTDL